MRKCRKNITVIKNQIDYDKLAEAFVRANEKLEKKNKEKKKQSSKFRAALMGYINGVVYVGVAIFSVLTIVGMWVEYSQNAKHSLITNIVFSALFAVVGIYAFLSEQESFKDSAEDSQKYFNTNVSLIALIISIIALLKGVG